MSAADTVDALRRAVVVPVVRTRDGRHADTMVDWLLDAGFRTVELTLTTPGAMDLLRRLAPRPDLLVGAGTVLDGDAARACIAAGARFVVSPVVEPEVAQACKAADVACVLGALTPTEVLRAARAGASAVKVFPVSCVGGPAYLRALRSILPGVVLAPTGGIRPGTVRAHVEAGAAFVGVGGELVDERAVAAGDRARILSCAAGLLAECAEVRAAAAPPQG